MTPRERAEKIIAFLDENNITMTDNEWDMFTKETTAQIEEAEREAINRVILGVSQTQERGYIISILDTKSYEKGFRAAREKAADIVEKHLLEAMQLEQPAKRWLAERIRGMKLGK